MKPTKRKGEQPVREAAEDEVREREARAGGAPGVERDEERAEDEGSAQPESSAQKHPAPADPGQQRYERE